MNFLLKGFTLLRLHRDYILEVKNPSNQRRDLNSVIIGKHNYL